MKLFAALLALSTLALPAAETKEEPPLPGYAWYRLEKLDGQVLAPAGWFCRGIRVFNGLGYQVTKEEVTAKISDAEAEFENRPSHGEVWNMTRLTMRTYRTGFNIRVISGAKWNQNLLSKLADGMIQDAQRWGRATAVIAGTDGSYTSRRLERDAVEMVGTVMETQHFVELILLDTATPTMVLVTFDCPKRDWPSNRDYCDEFLATLTLFRDSNDPSHSPYPTPELAAQVVSPHQPR